MSSQLNSEPMARAMASLRQEFAPKPGDPRGVREDCQVCGTPFYRWKGRRRLKCPDCAATYGAAAGASMAHRAGSTYERAVVGQLRHWTAEAERLGLSTAGPLGDPDSRET